MANGKSRGLYDLLLIAGVLILCTGFTIGLTFAPCYASDCSEDFFPSQTRSHIAVYYALLASTGALLLLRAYSPWWRAASESSLTRRALPILGRRISIGGLFMAIWLTGVTVATTPIWLSPEVDHWIARTNAVNWSAAHVDLVVTSITGHHIDIILGLVLIPVGRNGILARVFSVHQGTLLYAHKLLAYLLLVGVFAHAVAYFSFAGIHGALQDTSPKKRAFNVNNPFYTQEQIEQGGRWHAATLATGTLSFILILAITVTALPVLRRNFYNTFYYFHVIGGSAMLILAGMHCSTDFYFMLPGLILWAMDWAWRLFRGDTGLTTTVVGRLETAEGGWCRITLPPVCGSISSTDTQGESLWDSAESLVLEHPLQTYYLNIPSLSSLQNHAFTAAKAGSAKSGPVILFQRSQLGVGTKEQKKLDKEWTWKAAAAASVASAEKDMSGHDLKMRVEGPYAPREVSAFETSALVICVVGGTGLTGAYSLAQWWLTTRRRESHARFVMIWTVRHRETARLREWTELMEVAQVGISNVHIVLHVTSEEGRLDVAKTLRECMDSFAMDMVKQTEQAWNAHAAGNSAWVYVSGPAGLLDMAEDACVDLEREMKQRRKADKTGTDPASAFAIDRLDRYISRWEV